MIESYEIDVVLNFYRGGEEDLEQTIEEMVAYQKTYEHDQVTVLQMKESGSTLEQRKQYIITLRVERDPENPGRRYESEEEKLFGFNEDQAE